MKLNKIGVFDSGIGGLYVLQEIYNKYPKCQYYYYGDTKNMPYGSKSIEELKNYAVTIIDYFKKINVDMIICACGTMSTNVLNFLNEISDVPVLSVIDPTINYLNSSNLDNILVISTLNTHKSNYFINNCNKNITSVPLNDLAYLIEENKDLNSYLDKNLIIDSKIDAIVLGCTHYVKIASYLESKYNIDIINMGKCLASGLVLDEASNPAVNIYFSNFSDKLFDNVNSIIKMENVICQNLLK